MNASSRATIDTSLAKHVLFEEFTGSCGGRDRLRDPYVPAAHEAPNGDGV